MVFSVSLSSFSVFLSFPSLLLGISDYFSSLHLHPYSIPCCFCPLPAVPPRLTLFSHICLIPHCFQPSISLQVPDYSVHLHLLFYHFMSMFSLFIAHVFLFAFCFVSSLCHPHLQLRKSLYLNLPHPYFCCSPSVSCLFGASLLEWAASNMSIICQFCCFFPLT